MKKIIFCCALLFFKTLTAALEYEPLVGKLHEYDCLTSHTRSIVTFVRDPHGKKYIIKQYRYKRYKSLPATSLCELVALDVGHSIGVSLNHACLIPASVSFIGKDIGAHATLHTHVPGVPFDKYRKHGGKRYKGLKLKQKDESKRPVGLSRELIYHMSRHKGLPKMVALDTFVCNMGRLSHNYFYDEKTDTFYGIDMASSFYKDICKPSIKNIKALLSDKHTRFSRAEGKALMRYYKTYKKLVAMYTPEDLINKLDTYTQLAGYYDDDFVNKRVEERCLRLLAERKKTILKSYSRTAEYLEVLEKLLTKHKLL